MMENVVGFNVYPLFRNLLFKLDAEKAHHLGLKGLKLADSLNLNSNNVGRDRYSVNVPG